MKSNFALLPLNELTKTELEWRIAQLKHNKVEVHNSLPPTASSSMLQVAEVQIIALNRTIERLTAELQNR